MNEKEAPAYMINQAPLTEEGRDLRNNTEQYKTDIKQALISYIKDLSKEERKELLEMWKGRKQT